MTSNLCVEFVTKKAAIQKDFDQRAVCGFGCMGVLDWKLPPLYRQQCEGKSQKDRNEKERDIMSINVCGNQTDPVGGDATTSWEYNVTPLFFLHMS